MDFLKLYGFFSLIQFGRYILIAGGAYLFFWSRPNTWTQKKRIQKKDFTPRDLKREFLYSIVSSLIFGLILSFSFPDINKVRALQLMTSWPNVLFEVFILVLVHDTYFYWMHRLVHHPLLFNTIHKVHHLSTNPSPFAALSFHPIEALLEIVWICPIAYFFHFEMITWVIFGFVIIFINVLGHLNVEVYSRRWKANAILKYLNYSKDHNDHHKHFHGNYGLYLSIWDRWMKTYRAESYSTE